MKNGNENIVKCDNTNDSISVISTSQMNSDLSNRNNLRERPISTESLQKSLNISDDRVKTNLIYILTLVIVALIASLCYTLILLYEETNDFLLEPRIDDISEDDLKPEQYKWFQDGIKELRNSVTYERNRNEAKNVILFVGDGMGISTTTAARIYKYGEGGQLSWETFPHLGLLKVSKLQKYT